MTGEQIFTLLEHLFIVITLALIVIAGPGRIKQIQAVVRDIQVVLERLIELEEKTNGSHTRDE